jgi:predicted Zn-dependent protease
MVTKDRLQELYDRHRFLDAFSLSRDLWTTRRDLRDMSIDELILGGRLAWRLGGLRLSRWLFREAVRRSPHDIRVRAFTSHLRFLKRRLLDDLRAFEDQPDPAVDDPELAATWFIGLAGTWAQLRDFRRAYDCLERARAATPDDVWVLSMESAIHGFADRREEALASAEHAWAVDPGAPVAGEALGQALVALGRVADAAGRVGAAAAETQSWELVLYACWLQCALAETRDGHERTDVLRKATTLADRMPALAPLADRDTRVMMARARLDIAALSDDYTQIERWVGEVRSPFHRKVVANLRARTSGRRIRLPFQRILQKRDTCLPASLCAVLAGAGIAIDVDAFARDTTHGGTPDWAASAWLRDRGLHVRSFAVTSAIAAQLIHRGIAFVLVSEDDESGHAVAAVGLDERAGTLLVHDPQAFRSTEYLLSMLDDVTSPLGAKAMAVVPSDRAAELDALVPEDAAVQEAVEAYWRASILIGPSATEAIVAVIDERFPAHPGVRYLRAYRRLHAGHAGEALPEFLALLQAFPKSPLVRLAALFACHAMGNLAHLRQVFEDIVERGVLPGFSSEQEWLRPPDRYVYEYADMLAMSAATRDRAEGLLHALLRRQPASAGAWHVLADLMQRKPDPKAAQLCHRLSSCLAISNEHYAQAYATSLAASRQEQDGLDWLESRARAAEGSRRAPGPWVSWIAALEAQGRPGPAVDACREALERHGSDAELLMFVVGFYARMGLWDQAEAQLEALALTGNSAAFHEASARFLRMRGDHRGAMDPCAAWIDEAPHSIDARSFLLQLTAAVDGPGAALQKAHTWLRANRHHEAFEGVYCDCLDRAGGPRWKKVLLLRRRLMRNREDAWAWRELTFEYLQACAAAPPPRRARIEHRIVGLLAECNRTAAEDVATLRAHALWCEVRGDWAAAVTAATQCLALDARDGFSFQMAWRCSARSHQLRDWVEIRPLLLNSPVPLSTARQMIALLSERFGPVWAEAEVARWREERPEDPDVLEAAVDLLIEHGHGVSDADRALAQLGPAIEGYPYHLGLRLSLAGAYRRKGDHAAADEVSHEIVRRHPDHWPTRIQIAWIRHAKGDPDGALQSIDDAVASEPFNAQIWTARVQLLIVMNRPRDARDCVLRGLQQMPDDVIWRRQAVQFLRECREGDAAAAAAREGVARAPRSALAWLILGETLLAMRRYAAPGEAESCLRRSLTLDASLLESADLLSCVLVDQERHDEALAVVKAIEPRMADPSPARGRRAWITRRRGSYEAAVKDMAEVVEDAPWFTWGWSVLMGWLEEDKSWLLARRLLKHVPDQLAANVMFRNQRLDLLLKAGVDRGELRSELAVLQRDFPAEEALQATHDSFTGDTQAAPSLRAPFSFAAIPWWAWYALTFALFSLTRACD